jgi:PhnB protein
MTAKVRYIPEGFHTATPFLALADGARAVEFYKKAFEAVELSLHQDANGRVRHAELKIGDSPIMLGEHREVDARDSALLPRVSVYLYVEDADAVARQAIAAGGKEIYAVREQSYGNREGGVEDPFGIVWWIGTRVKEVAH